MNRPPVEASMVDLDQQPQLDRDVSGDRPRVLHPTSLLFQILAAGRQNLLPVIVVGWSAVQGSTVGWFIAGAIVGLALLFAVVRYLTFRYRLADGELIVTEGLIFRRKRTVPVDRIQNVDLVQTPLHRILRVAEVRVETASGTEPEATLRVLSMADVAKLRGEIFARRRAVVDATDTAAEPSSAAAGESSATLLQIPTKWLVKAGLASNRGMILIGVVLGIFFQQNWHEDIDFDQLADNVPRELLLSPWVLVPAGVVGTLLLIRILGVGWYLLRFHGYRLERVGGDFHLSCGLLTKVSATVPRRRIQFISIHRTPLLRWMKMASIRIETAGGAGNDNENAAATVTRRWFVPIIPDALVSTLIQQLHPGFSMDESSVVWQRVSPRAGRRLLRLSMACALIASLIGIAITGPWGLLVGAALLPLFVLWSRLHLRALGYARVADGIIFRSGVWTRKTSVTFFDKIQTLGLSQSLFDRRWGMATLSIDTAASGPADHAISVPMLESDCANAEIETLAGQSASAGMAWD
jgi:putative membrane protein